MIRRIHAFFETGGRRGLWFLLVAVGLGTALQILALPGEGQAVPAPLDQEPATARRTGVQPLDQGALEMIRRGGRPPMSEEDWIRMTPKEEPDPVEPEWDEVEHVAGDRRAASGPGPAAIALTLLPTWDSAAGPRGVPSVRSGAEPVRSPDARPSPRRIDGGRGSFHAFDPPAAPAPPAEEDEDPGDEPEDPLAPSPDPEAPAGPAGPQGAAVDRAPETTHLILIGPSAVAPRAFATFTLAVENAENLAHAPIQISYDPEVLEFVSATEGPFLASDGAATQFLASTSALPGFLDIAISRMPPAGGISGRGVLCEIVFMARSEGMSPIVTAGTRLLDSDVRSMSFRRSDAYVSVD